MATAHAQNVVGFNDLGAVMPEMSEQSSVVATTEGRVGLFRGPEIRFNAEMNLHLSAGEPAAAALGELGRLGNLFHAQQVDEEAPGRASARRHGELDVVDGEKGCSGHVESVMLSVTGLFAVSTWQFAFGHLGAYSIPSETGLLIPSVNDSNLGAGRDFCKNRHMDWELLLPTGVVLLASLGFVYAGLATIFYFRSRRVDDAPRVPVAIVAFALQYFLVFTLTTLGNYALLPTILLFFT
jgi:hypothetical protein